MQEILVSSETSSYNSDVEIHVLYPLFEDVNGNTGSYVFNVNPSSLDIQADGNVAVSNILNLGQIVRLKKGQLHQISWSGFLPFKNDMRYVSLKEGSISNNGFTTQEQMIHLFERMRIEMKPCRIVIVGLDINMMAALTSFKWAYRGGTRDIDYSLSFIEYVPYGLIHDTSIVATNTADVNESKVPENTSLSINANVKATGIYYADSEGGGGSGSCNNEPCTITLINEGAEYPYHIANSSGALGWTNKDSLSLGG